MPIAQEKVDKFLKGSKITELIQEETDNLKIGMTRKENKPTLSHFLVLHIRNLEVHPNKKSLNRQKNQVFLMEFPQKIKK